MKQILLNIEDIINKILYMLNRKQKFLCVIVFFMTIIGAAFETIGVSIILPFVQAIMFPEQLMEKKVIASMVNFLGLTEPMQIIILTAVGVVLVYLVKNIYLIVLAYVRAKFSSAIQRSLGVRMIRSYMKRGYPYFLTVNVSQLYRGITGDVSGIYNILYNGYRLLAEILTVVLIGGMILFTDTVMSLCVLGVAGICMIISVFFSKKRMKRLGEEFRTYDAETKKCSIQAFQGIKEVLVMHKQDYFVGAYEKASRKQQNAMVEQIVAAESPTYIFETVCVIAMILAVYLRVLLGSDNSEFIPKLATMVIAAFRIMPSLGRIANNANNIMFNIPSMNAVFMNLKEANEYDQKVQSAVIEEDKSWDLQFQATLELRDVTWHYEGTDRNVIEKLNLVIHKGDSIAFIGESGAGKSTVADIILGLFRPDSGAVYMDGIDIKTIPLTWCRIIGYVPQTIYILDDSIRKNVAYGVREEEIDDNMVWTALEQAQLKAFVEMLPNQLDTVLGDRGIRFSGGQRQRIAIARALYYNPDIMVLDEATSALDNKTEEAIMEAIDYLRVQKTLIIVAHRLSTIRQCNHVYMIKDGGLVEMKKEEVIKSENIGVEKQA